MKDETCQKSSIPRVGSGHQVGGGEHLTDQLGDGELSVVHRTPGCQGGKARHEEVKSAQYFWLKLREISLTDLGKGTMLTASFLRSALSWPGNLRQVVTPDMVRDTRWFRSP